MTFEQIKSAFIQDHADIRSSNVTPDGEYFVCSTRAEEKTVQSTIYIINTDTLECVDQIIFLKGIISRNVCCENKRYIIVKYYNPIMPREYFYELFDRETRCWTDLNDYKEMGELSVCENIGFLCIQNQGKLIVFDPVIKKTVMESDVGKSKIAQSELLSDGVLCVHTRKGKTVIFDISSGVVIGENNGMEVGCTINRPKEICAFFGIFDVYIYDYHHNILLSKISSFWMRVLCANFSGDNERIVTSSGAEVTRVWESDKKQYICHATELHSWANFLVPFWIKQDTQYIISYRINDIGYLRFLRYDIATNQLLESKDFKQFYDYHYVDQSVYLIKKTTINDSKITDVERYDINTFEWLQSWQILGDYAIHSISPDGKFFFIRYVDDRYSEKHVVYVFDTQMNSIIREIVSDEKMVYWRYSPDRKQIIVMGMDKSHRERLHIYDSSTFEYQCTIVEYNDIGKFDIRSDGVHLAVSHDYSVDIIDLHTQKTVKKLKQPERRIPLVTYSPDGKKLITATENGTIYIWDTQTYECIQTIPNVPGLYIQGVDLRNLAPGSDFTEEDKRILRMYGALID